jgi:hypothetical protein
MSASISFNPYSTSNAAGSFNVSSEGFVQGVFLDDPALRYQLAGGTYTGVSQPTLPMIGGAAITEGIRDGTAGVGTLPASGANASLGTLIDYASTNTAASGANAALGQVTGFSVLNQANHGITTPASTAPTFSLGNSVNFLRLGSGMKLAVAMDPGLVSASGYLITSYFSWDFNTQTLTPYDAATGTVTINSMTWAATNGGQFAVVTAAASLVSAVGDVINISGATGNGTGGNNAVNGNFVVNTFTDNEHFTVLATNPGGSAYYGTVAGSPVINEGTGHLNVRVTEFNVGNSMTYTWDPVNNVANWNRNGSCAVIIL